MAFAYLRSISASLRFLLALYRSVVDYVNNTDITVTRFCYLKCYFALVCLLKIPVAIVIDVLGQGIDTPKRPCAALQTSLLWWLVLFVLAYVANTTRYYFAKTLLA